MSEYNTEYLEKYVSLLEAFCGGEIYGPEFETRFLRLHRDDRNYYPEEIHVPISILFSDVDEYCSDPALRDERDLDDEQILAKAKIALADLKKFEWK